MNMQRRRMACWAAAAALVSVGSPAGAQKNSGPLLPTAPPPAYNPPAYSPPRMPAMPRVEPSPRMPPPMAAGANPVVEQRAQSLPLDPQTRELRDQMPADPQGVERRLGLREARGPVTDLRGHTASSREIIDALRPR